MKITVLPITLAGPMLRHCDQTHFTLWFVTSKPLNQLSLKLGERQWQLSEQDYQVLTLGQRAFQYLIHLEQDDLLQPNQSYDYQVIDSEFGELFSQINELTYDEAPAPSVQINPQLKHVLHGSCRKPHHHSHDALVSADQLLAEQPLSNRPDLLMFTGDQVYIDDVAGPMLYAIGAAIKLLGLPVESFPNANIAGSQQLSYLPGHLYQRANKLLPHTEYPAKTPLWHWYINHPIFTSSCAANHLVSLNEIIAMYLLVWSPELWLHIDVPKHASGLSPELLKRWDEEWHHLVDFQQGLTQARRLMAHVPTYMIFDDHDITDDWNLTAKWEKAAYQHKFSKRIIGNALIGYALFQGIGNQPQKFTNSLMPQLKQLFVADQHRFAQAIHDQLIQSLLDCEDWHYELATTPKLVVLDTRTRRWRDSELSNPSGLMDWEALMGLQESLMHEKQVLLVSPAPIFGVKFIEVVQKFFSSLGATLLVDAENWMAHRGAAISLLSIFNHRQTPQQFTILSGDVHYSFAYDIKVRHHHQSPQITQVTCSGLKNQFPEKLLPVFDRLNRLLYGIKSPLNLLTKRKSMQIYPRLPETIDPQGQTSAIPAALINQSGIGSVHFDAQGQLTRIEVIHQHSKTQFPANPRIANDVALPLLDQ